MWAREAADSLGCEIGLIPRGTRVFCMVTRRCGSGRRREAAVFFSREARVPRFPPRIGGCVYAREAAVWHGRMLPRGIVAFDSIC